MTFYLAVKKTDIKLVGELMELESITLSEITQTQKDKCHMLSLTGGPSFWCLYTYTFCCVKSHTNFTIVSI